MKERFHHVKWGSNTFSIRRENLVKMFALSRSRREEKAFREIIIRSDLWTVTSSVVDARGRRGRGELAKAEGKRVGV